MRYLLFSIGVILALYSLASAPRSVAVPILLKNSSSTFAASTDAQPGAAGVSLEFSADAMRALAKDYADMKKGAETGQLPEDIVDRVTADGARVDQLCTAG